MLPTKTCRTWVEDKEWRDGRRSPTQDISTNNRCLCVGVDPRFTKRLNVFHNAEGNGARFNTRKSWYLNIQACAAQVLRQVLGSWVGVWRLFSHFLFLTAPRMALPQDPSTDPTCCGSCRQFPRADGVEWNNWYRGSSHKAYQCRAVFNYRRGPVLRPLVPLGTLLYG